MGSNDGWIKLWSLRVTEESPSCELICQVNAGVRITCLCSFTKRNSLTEEGKGKTKSEDNEEGETEKGDVKTTKRSENDANDDDEDKAEVENAGRTPGKKVKFS